MRKRLLICWILTLGACASDGADGADGEPCTVEDTTNGAVIRCPDGMQVPVADGEDGTNGTNGANGQNGADGRDGMNGRDGRDGVDGMNGTDGVDGADGSDGTPGMDGTDGIRVARQTVCGMTIANLGYLYHVTDFTTGDVIATCSVNDTARSSARTFFYEGTRLGASIALCTLTFDTGGDGLDFGGFLFERTAVAGAYQVTYLDPGDAADGWVGTFAASDCVTVMFTP